MIYSLIYSIHEERCEKLEMALSRTCSIASHEAALDTDDRRHWGRGQNSAWRETKGQQLFRFLIVHGIQQRPCLIVVPGRC